MPFFTRKTSKNVQKTPRGVIYGRFLPLFGAFYRVPAQFQWPFSRFFFTKFPVFSVNFDEIPGVYNGLPYHFFKKNNSKAVNVSLKRCNEHFWSIYAPQGIFLTFYTVLYQILDISENVTKMWKKTHWTMLHFHHYFPGLTLKFPVFGPFWLNSR